VQERERQGVGGDRGSAGAWQAVLQAVTAAGTTVMVNLSPCNILYIANYEQATA
jgi:hypothetical protein